MELITENELYDNEGKLIKIITIKEVYDDKGNMVATEIIAEKIVD